MWPHVHSSPRESEGRMLPNDRADAENPLGQNNIGRQMLLKMGWAKDAGLGQTDYMKIGQKYENWPEVVRA